MKVNRHVHHPTRQVSEAVARCAHVHLDIVGPLLAINNSPFRYLVTFIDRTQIGLKATQYISSLTMKFATLFLYPGFLASGYHFTSRLTVEPNLKVNFSPNIMNPTIPYNIISPTEQGKSRTLRFHRTFKAALMSSKSERIGALPVVLFGLRSKPDSNLISSLTATTGVDVLYPTTVAEKTAPITLAFVKKFQDNLEQVNTKDLRPTCTRQLLIHLVASGPSKKPLGAPNN